MGQSDGPTRFKGPFVQPLRKKKKSDLAADCTQPPKFPQSHTDSQTSSNTSEIREINHKILPLHRTTGSKSNFSLQLFAGPAINAPTSGNSDRLSRAVTGAAGEDGADGSTARVTGMTPSGGEGGSSTGIPTSCSTVPPHCTAAAPPRRVTNLPFFFF